MLLGLISLLLSQSARWISEICVNSSLFNSKFYICSEEDYGIHKKVLLEHTSSTNQSSLPHHGIHEASHQCGHVNIYFFYRLKSLFSFWLLIILLNWMLDPMPGPWTICVVWGTRATPKILICPGYHSCSIQWHCHWFSHEQGTHPSS